MLHTHFNKNVEYVFNLLGKLYETLESRFFSISHDWILAVFFKIQVERVLSRFFSGA